MIIVLLDEKPFPGYVQDVLIAGITLEQIVHAGNGWQKIVVLDARHPTDEKLFIRSAVGEQRFCLGKRGGVGSGAARGERDEGVSDRGVRIFFSGVARLVRGSVVHRVFVSVPSELEGFTRFLGLGGKRNGAKEPL